MYWKIASCLMVIVFFAWVRVELYIKARKDEDAEEAFWERERKSNSVRKKPIEHLNYVKVPEDLPFDLVRDNPKGPEIEKILNNLREEKILNLSGLTNTDIKLEYGTANLPVLSKCDQYYTTFSLYMQKLADVLLEEEHEEEAIHVMEELVKTNSDIKKTYVYLGQYYLNTFNKEAYNELLERAENLTSFNKDMIVSAMKELS